MTRWFCRWVPASLAATLSLVVATGLTSPAAIATTPRATSVYAYDAALDSSATTDGVPEVKAAARAPAAASVAAPMGGIWAAYTVFVAAETGAGRTLNLPFRDPELSGQVNSVVDHFDEFGAPPSGVAQGGLKGYPKGTYGNKSGALPQQELGYYTESDIYPSGGDVKRGAERLIFGGDGEVWFTPDHYDTFFQIR